MLTVVISSVVFMRQIRGRERAWSTLVASSYSPIPMKSMRRWGIPFCVRLIQAREFGLLNYI